MEDSTEAAPDAANGKAIATFRSSGISVSVFENAGKDGSVFCKVSPRRNYKARDGQFRSTTSFAEADIPVLVHLLQKSFDFLIDRPD